jgi:hypothetical protein
MAVSAPLDGSQRYDYLSTHYPEMAESVRIYYEEYHSSHVRVIIDYDVMAYLSFYIDMILNGHRGDLTPEHRKMFEIADNNSNTVRSNLRSVFP